MPDQRDIPEQTPTSERSIEQPQAISLEVAATIAGEVRDLIQAGEEQSAWERLHSSPRSISRTEPRQLVIA